MSDKRRLAGELAIEPEREGGGRSPAQITSSSGSAERSVDGCAGWRANARAHVGATAGASGTARGARGAPPDGLHDDPSADTRACPNGSAHGLFNQGRGIRDCGIVETRLRIPGHHY
jgi:hypothetical protein